MLVAVTVCVPACDGAVYKPELLIVPTDEFPPLIVSTDQVTLVLEAPLTVAVNCTVELVATSTEDLFNTTLTGGGGPPEEEDVPPHPAKVVRTSASAKQQG